MVCSMSLETPIMQFGSTSVSLFELLIVAAALAAVAAGVEIAGIAVWKILLAAMGFALFVRGGRSGA